MRLKLAMILLLLQCSVCSAQDNPDKKPKVFDGGIILGADISKVDGDTYSGYHKIGIQAGGQVCVHFNPIFGASLELLYAQKGARGGNVKESIYLGTYIDKYFLDLHYIELPVMLHYGRRYFTYEAGIAYALLLKANEWAEADVPVLIYPDLSYFNKEDYEGVLGLTCQFSKHWFGSIRFQYSLKPIRTWDRVPPRYSQYGVGEYNNMVNFRVIYRL
jgi:hypothetical protein